MTVDANGPPCLERKLDASGECFRGQRGRLPALDDRLNDFRRQESQADQAAHVAHRESFARSDRSKRSCLV
jgi:hypothetical protein